MTAYKAYDPVVEWFGPCRESVSRADRDARQHDRDLAAAGGFGSAIVVREDGEGYCETLDGETVWPSHGRSNGAVRWA